MIGGVAAIGCLSLGDATQKRADWLIPDSYGVSSPGYMLIYSSSLWANLIMMCALWKLLPFPLLVPEIDISDVYNSQSF